MGKRFILLSTTIILLLLSFISIHCGSGEQEYIVYQKYFVDRATPKTAIVLAHTSGRTKGVLKQEGHWFSYPRFSPDKKWVSFTKQDLSAQYTDEYGQTWPKFQQDIYLININDRNERLLTGGLNGSSYNASWSPDGRHLVFCFQPRIPGHTYRYTGEVFLYLVDVASNSFDTLDTSGQVPGSAEFSPDGRNILYVNTVPQYVAIGDRKVGAAGGPGQKSEIWIMDRDAGNKRRLTQGEFDISPSFSPDGSQIVFTRRHYRFYGNKEPYFVIYIMNSDGKDLKKIIEDGQEPRFSPDGRKLIFVRRPSGTGYTGLVDPGGVYRVDIDGRNIKRIVADKTIYRVLFHEPDWR